jgi:hypothetical protein
MLIDNGSDITLVKDKFFKDSLPLSAKSKCTIRGVTEGTPESYGSSVLTMNFGDANNMDHENQIVSKKFGIHADGTIGRDFLTKHKCLIDYDTYTLTINHKNARIDVTLLDTSIMLPARSEIIRKQMLLRLPQPILFNTKTKEWCFLGDIYNFFQYEYKRG